MSTETAFTENEVARRWNISPKTLQRWRSDKFGPPYLKLSKAVRYAVDEIVAYEQLHHRGMREDAPLPSLIPMPAPEPVVGSAVAVGPEPKRYTLSEAVALIAQYGSLAAAESAVMEWRDGLQG